MRKKSKERYVFEIVLNLGVFKTPITETFQLYQD